MSSFQYHQFLYGADNYGVLMHDPKTGQTAAIDAGDLDSYLQAITETGWSLSHILVTHHHPDHTDGLTKLAQQTGAAIFGPSGDRPIHQCIETYLSDGDHFDFAGH
ncbi:MAG: MBL fold metallo-hydrolase, partial [Candidatus Puniceispirillaceae bacterium]